MKIAKILLISCFVAPLFISQAQAEQSWSEKVRSTWERVKGIGDKSVETAEEIEGKKRSKEPRNENHRSDSEDDRDRSKGWERAKEAGGKVRGSERSKHQRIDGEKSWKKDKDGGDDDHVKKKRGIKARVRVRVRVRAREKAIRSKQATAFPLLHSKSDAILWAFYTYHCDQF